MGVWPTPWAQVCMLEANRFWFYSLVISISWGSVKMFRQQPGESGRTEKQQSEKERPRTLIAKEARKGQKHGGAGIEERRQIQRRLVTDVFDLFVPGHVTGWIPTSLATVGFSSVISTVLSLKDIWDRLREESQSL